MFYDIGATLQEEGNDVENEPVADEEQTDLSSNAQEEESDGQEEDADDEENDVDDPKERNDVQNADEDQENRAELSGIFYFSLI